MAKNQKYHVDSFHRAKLKILADAHKISTEFTTDDMLAELAQVAGEEAVKHFRLVSGSPGASLHDAYEAAAKDDFQRAEAILDKIGESKDPRWVAESKAHLYATGGLLTDALAHVKSYNGNAPLQEWLFKVEADLLYRLDRPGELKRLCTVWGDFDIDRLNYHLNVARVMYMHGDLKKAARIIDGLLVLEPLEEMARLLKGDILVKLKRYDEAIEQYNQALEIDDNIILLTAYIRALIAGGYRQDALEMCNDFQSEYGSHPELQELRKTARA